MANVNKHTILVIANKPPYPVIDGGCFAMSKFEQLLRPIAANLFYFAVSTPKHPFKEEALPEYWDLNTNFFTSFINTTISKKHVARYLTGSSIRAVRFYTKETEDLLLGLISKHRVDTVVFESIYSAVYLKAIKSKTNARCLIRTHNIEHRIWEKHFEEMPRGLKKLAFKSETERLKKFEEQCLSHSDGNIFISENDKDYADHHLSKIRSVTIPVQVETTATLFHKSNPLKLFHIGAMDWQPNVEGVKKFLNEVFPFLQKEFPGIELHLAGKAMPEEFREYASGSVFIHGEVPDANEFISRYDVSIVPILSGSGIRIKILEAMAHGKPVVTTPAGIYGIPATPGEHYLPADSIEGWKNAISRLNDPELYKQISQNGIDFIHDHYSTSILQPLLTEFINQ